jgi:hypothetical protein
MRLTIERIGAHVTSISVQQAVGEAIYGMTQRVSHVEIENSLYCYRTFIARRVVEMRRTVRAEIARHG